MSSDSSTTVAITTAQIMCGALLISTAVYAGTGFVLVQMEVIPEGGLIGPEKSTTGMISIVFVAVAAALAAVSFPVRTLLTRRISPGSDVVHARTRVAIASMAIAESSGVLGLAFCLLFADIGTSFVLWGLALGAGVFHFPTRAWLSGEPGA